jgi:bifunctional ADP-heptose synthase (sugar kinase/adenylyltransferase)
MDTRTKIVSQDIARQFAAGSVIVSGYFDPMTKEHAERLQSLKKPGKELLVLIATPANPILPSGARAALVAGLACVDHVTEIGGAYPDGLTPQVQLETEDAERLALLIDHVRLRQQAGN